MPGPTGKPRTDSGVGTAACWAVATVHGVASARAIALHRSGWYAVVRCIRISLADGSVCDGRRVALPGLQFPLRYAFPPIDQSFFADDSRSRPCRITA